MSFESYKYGKSRYLNYSDVQKTNSYSSSNERTSETSAIANSHQKSSHHSKNAYEGSFPSKLYHMLEYIEIEGLSHIASWQPHERAFIIHEPDTFINTIARKYFKQSKFTSFQRQLNLYGFTRIKTGPDKEAYYHPNFLRAERHLMKNIIRTPVKGTRHKRFESCTKSEPNFLSASILASNIDGAILSQEQASVEMTSVRKSASLFSAKNGHLSYISFTYFHFHVSHQNSTDSFCCSVNQMHGTSQSSNVFEPYMNYHTEDKKLEQNDISLKQSLGNTSSGKNSEFFESDCLNNAKDEKDGSDEFNFDDLLKILRESD